MITYPLFNSLGFAAAAAAAAAAVSDATTQRTPATHWGRFQLLPGSTNLVTPPAAVAAAPLLAGYVDLGISQQAPVAVAVVAAAMFAD